MFDCVQRSHMVLTNNQNYEYFGIVSQLNFIFSVNSQEDQGLV